MLLQMMLMRKKDLIIIFWETETLVPFVVDIQIHVKKTTLNFLSKGNQNVSLTSFVSEGPSAANAPISCVDIFQVTYIYPTKFLASADAN